MEWLDRRDVLDKGYVELIDYMGSDMSVVNSARVSYLSESKGKEQDRKLVHYLMKHRHTTPFEQVEFQWRVKCPLFVRSQWHRHRTWSYNEISRRYTSEDIEFYIPDEWREQDTDNKQSSLAFAKSMGGKMTYFLDKAWEYCQNSVNLYNRMLDAGIAREQARMVLPQNLYTIFYAKVDLHNLLHFIGLRSDEHAQWEIRQYSDSMLEMVEPIVPWSIDAWRKYYG